MNRFEVLFQSGLISSKQNFVDCSKPDICETVDIHSEVSRHVETVCLLSKKNFLQEKRKLLYEPRCCGYYQPSALIGAAGGKEFKAIMEPMDLIREKFSQDCTIETVLHLVMAHFNLSEEEAQEQINEYFEIIESLNK